MSTASTRLNPVGLLIEVTFSAAITGPLLFVVGSFGLGLTIDGIGAALGAGVSRSVGRRLHTLVATQLNTQVLEQSGG